MSLAITRAQTSNTHMQVLSSGMQARRWSHWQKGIISLETRMKVLRYCIADLAIKLYCSAHLASFLPSSASGLRRWRGCCLKVSSKCSIFDIAVLSSIQTLSTIILTFPFQTFHSNIHSTLRRQSRTDSQWRLWSSGKRPWGNRVVPQAMPRRSRAALPGKLWGMIVYAASLLAAVNVFSLEVFPAFITLNRKQSCRSSHVLGRLGMLYLVSRVW